MRRAVVVCLLVACGEHPSLRVEVTHHADAAPVVTRTTISVYESDVVSCEKVEFGDVSEVELTAIEVDQIAVGPGERADELTMSREGTKVIVVRGFDKDGALIAADCAEKGTVGEGDVLAIGPTKLAASVSVSGIGLVGGDPFGIEVTVTDPFVRSLDGRTVSWRVHGADGAQPFDALDLDPVVDSTWVPAAPSCSDINGVALVHPVPPATIGGFATAVRTAWSTEPNRVFTTFTPLDPDAPRPMKPVADNANVSQRRCAPRVAKVGSQTVHRLVCLEDRAGVATAIDYEIGIKNGGASYTERDTFDFPAIPQTEPPINVFSIPRGELRDVYAITTRGRIVGVFTPSVPGDPSAKLPAGSTVTDVAVLPACGSSEAALLVRVETATTKVMTTLAVSPTGTLGLGETLKPYPSPGVSDQEGLAINATGCVAEIQINGETTLRQIGVIDVTGRSMPGVPRNTTTGFVECDKPNLCPLPFAAARAGVGFLPADALHPERIVSATFDASGTVLAISVLSFDKERKPRLVELERITAASFPQHVVAGQLDADGVPDLFWNIFNLNNTSTNFQVSYAHPVLGERLSALSSTLEVAVVDTFVADVTGEGDDDLVITTQDSLLPTGIHTILVLPGRSPIFPFMIERDTECTPR